MDPRQAALAAMLTNAGNNRVAQDPAMWQRVVRPAFTKPAGSTANQVASLWNTRNTSVTDARNTETAALFSALDALGQRQLEDAKKNQQTSGGGGGGGGRTSSTRPTTTLPPPTPSTSSWWFDQFIADLPPIPTAPTYPTRPRTNAPRPNPDRIDRPAPQPNRRTPTTTTTRRTTPTIPRTGAF